MTRSGKKAVCKNLLAIILFPLAAVIAAAYPVSFALQQYTGPMPWERWPWTMFSSAKHTSAEDPPPKPDSNRPSADPYQRYTVGDVSILPPRRGNWVVQEHSEQKLVFNPQVEESGQVVLNAIVYITDSILDIEDPGSFKMGVQEQFFASPESVYTRLIELQVSVDRVLGSRCIRVHKKMEMHKSSFKGGSLILVSDGYVLENPIHHRSKTVVAMLAFAAPEVPIPDLGVLCREFVSTLEINAQGIVSSPTPDPISTSRSEDKPAKAMASADPNRRYTLGDVSILPPGRWVWEVTRDLDKILMFSALWDDSTKGTLLATVFHWLPPHKGSLGVESCRQSVENELKDGSSKGSYHLLDLKVYVDSLFNSPCIRFHYKREDHGVPSPGGKTMMVEEGYGYVVLNLEKPGSSIWVGLSGMSWPGIRVPDLEAQCAKFVSTLKIHPRDR